MHALDARCIRCALADFVRLLRSICLIFFSRATDFPTNPPARATYAVKDLPKGGLVEIEAVAVHN